MAVFTRRGDDEGQYEPVGVEPSASAADDLLQVFDSRDVPLQQLNIA